MSGWQLNNKTAQTYFTSEFFDFTNCNETSKIEDFDISKQYLNSELSEKSVILRELNQQYFLQALVVYDKVCLYASLHQWRKINQKYKFQSSRSPQNMTKVFLKVFYLINKKTRTKIQKSFLKIHNFTQNNEMKTYETPLIKGIKKLNQTFKSMDQKYFYNHPIKSQQMEKQAFQQIVFRVRTIKNRTKIENMLILINKMSFQISLKQFYEILGGWQKSLQKIEIFVGSLNLFVNPIKRNAFYQLKKCQFLSKQTLFWNKTFKQQFQDSDMVILNKDIFSQDKVEYEQILNDCIDQEQSLNAKQKTFIMKERKIFTLDEQDYEEKTPKKSLLSFSKDLRRKGSNEKKNKLKFKTVPGNTPESKKNKQLKQISTNNIKKEQFVQINFDSEQQQKHLKLKIDSQKMNQLSKYFNLKVNKICLNFENSLSFESRSTRNITAKEQSVKLNPLRPQELSFSFPDYFDISSYSDMPQQLSTLNLQKAYSSKEQIKKSPSKTFKTIKSGKSISFLEKNNLNSQKSLPKSDKISSDIYRFKTAENQPIIIKINQQISKVSKLQKNKSDLIKISKSNSKSDLSPKHQYLFPITKVKNNELGMTSKIVSKNKKDNKLIISEYHSHPLQASVQKCQQALNSNKSLYLNGKNNLLSFNTNRPMKKVKSPRKDSITKMKSSHSKKQKKSKQKQKHLKSKKAKQIKSQYYDSHNQTSNFVQKFKNQDFTTLSMKSLKVNSLERPKIKSVLSKEIKK